MFHFLILTFPQPKNVYFEELGLINMINVLFFQGQYKVMGMIVQLGKSINLKILTMEFGTG